MKKLIFVLAFYSALSQAQSYNYSGTYTKTTPAPIESAGRTTVYTDKYGRPTGYANTYGSTTYYADKYGTPKGSATTYGAPVSGAISPTYDPYLVAPSSPIK